MKIIINIILSLIFLAIIIPIAALTYFGFMPGLSAAFGTNKPRDLGVKYSETDRKNAYEKNAVIAVAITPASASIKDSVRYEGKKDIKITLTGSEISSLINSRKWKYSLSQNVQIRINPDGTGEMSGTLNINNVLPYISLTHSITEVKDAIEKYKIGFNPPYYLKGKVEITNNKVTLNPEQIEIGRIPIPQSLITQNQAAVTTFVEDRLNAIPNLSVRSLKLQNGQAVIDATVPEKEFTVQN